jgi:hypothetical protein
MSEVIDSARHELARRLPPSVSRISERKEGGREKTLFESAVTGFGDRSTFPKAPGREPRRWSKKKIDNFLTCRLGCDMIFRNTERNFTSQERRAMGLDAKIRE